MRLITITIIWVGFLSVIMNGQSIDSLKSNEQYNLKVNTMDTKTDHSIHGKTIQWAWLDGFVDDTTAEYTHEHTFHKDGTVTWKTISGPHKGHSNTENEFASIEVADKIYVVSYLAESGHTLTVVLNFNNKRMTGFASGMNLWHAGSGPFKVVE